MNCSGWLMMCNEGGENGLNIYRNPFLRSIQFELAQAVSGILLYSAKMFFPNGTLKLV